MAAGELRSLIPVVVHGAANAHAFDAARESAAQSLARLCALLSVATDHVWEVIETPRADPLDPAGLPLSRLPLPPYPEPDSPDLVELPEWVASASDLLPVGSLLALALGAHHQGMLMERRFSSYSMIAYTGAIETIGKFLLPDHKAEVQYRAALKRIRSSSARQPFVKSYDLRSRTAHSGVLHAGEDLRGSFPAGAWIPRPDPSWTFRLLPLAESRRASRELLVLAATNQLG
ncbi:MAG: hypothetical protein HGA44_21760 [Cellulomonadaceae bacterium]|nr:hypothetical protein [Cellulomonadaceae bacterium]